jgi:hypothetical protein
MTDKLESSVQQEVNASTRGGADISECGTYRYRLWRHWDARKTVLPWVMLNPSTADATKDDATIRKCIGFAKRWGYGGIEIANIFALRSRHPSDLLHAVDPVGPRNDAVLELLPVRVGNDGHVICAWGQWGEHYQLRPRVAAVRELLRAADLVCLGLTGDGQPRHPLMLPYETDWRPYQAPQKAVANGF